MTDFYFGAISPYSWFAAERIGGLIAQARWRPVFAGGLFHAVGRVSWGVTDERAAHVAECEARARRYGLGPIRWPEDWPASDVQVARAMVAAEREGRLEPFALAAMRACFLEGTDPSHPDALAQIATSVGLDAGAVLEATGDPEVKAALRAVNEEAVARGVVGVPTVVTGGGELFWGDDRLEEAAAAAATAWRPRSR